MVEIYVDADACPVKQEVCRVAERYQLKVAFVANSWMQVPKQNGTSMVVVEDQFDAADDWIVERADPGDIVITTDIPLASRCIEKGALVLSPKGKAFTEDSIGDALATRELMSGLRQSGAVTGGPPPFQKQDRSLFLQRLDQMVHAARRIAGA